MSTKAYTDSRHIRRYNARKVDGAGVWHNQNGEIKGNVVTPFGYVQVYSHYKGTHSHLFFAYGGFEFCISWECALSKKALVLRAARFAEECVNGEHG